MTPDAAGNVLAFAPESEGALCLVSGSGLDVFVFRGAQDWTRDLGAQGALDYGLFIVRDAPFFLVRIKGLLELAVGVNFLAQPADRLQAFMDQGGVGVCRLVLCGFPEPRILFERSFGVREDVMREIRGFGPAQIRAYADGGECAAAMAVMMRRLAAGRMIRSTVMYPDQHV